MSLSFIHSKYRTLGKKGEGTFSEVLKCQNIKEGTYVACKKMKQQYESLEQVNNLREIQAMRRLSPHLNILELLEVLFDKKSGTLVLICELMDMNIYELIRGKRHYLPEKTIKSYMYQLCKSVEHMHRNGIFHRDVKPENILIKDDLLKLADFGSCRSVYSKQPYTEYISTRWYRAPECLLTDGFYTYKMDIWSVGCVMFEIMSLHPLFPGSNEVDQIAKIHDIVGTPDPDVIAKFRNKARGMNFNFPKKTGSGIERLLPHANSDSIKLINSMCTYDPEERITAKQALRHPYFKELRDVERRQHAIAKAKREREKKDQERAMEAEEAEKENQDGDKEQEAIQGVKEAQNKSTVTNTTTDPVVHERKARKDKDRLREKENNLKELNSKYKLDPVELLKQESEKEKKKVTPRPESGTSTLTTSTARYPASILYGKDPVHGYLRREKKRHNYVKSIYSTVPQISLQKHYFQHKRKRNQASTLDTSDQMGANASLPKLNPNKPNAYLPSFQTSAYNQNGSLQKLGASSTSTTAFLPSLNPASILNTKASKAKTRQIYGGHYLPSIGRRDGF